MESAGGDGTWGGVVGLGQAVPPLGVEGNVHDR